MAKARAGFDARERQLQEREKALDARERDLNRRDAEVESKWRRLRSVVEEPAK